MVELLVKGGTISSYTHRHVKAVSLALLIEFVVTVGSIIHATYFFTELAMKASGVVLASAH